MYASESEYTRGCNEGGGRKESEGEEGKGTAKVVRGDKREDFYDRLNASTKDQTGQCVKGSMNARTSEARLRFHRSQVLRLYGDSCVRALWQRA